MGERSGVDWCDSSVNAIAGCDGCELWRPARVEEPGATRRADGSWWLEICYAGVATRNMVSNGPRAGWPASFDRPQLFSGRIEAAARWKNLRGFKRESKPWLDLMPRVIFLNDMGDTFTASLPLDWLAPFLPIMARSPHLWLILTKRPDRAAEFSQRHVLPSNVWIGTSITSAQDARLRALDRVLAALKFVSFEPVLAGAAMLIEQHPSIAWWIVGGGSGNSPGCEVSDIYDVVDACTRMSVPVFVKQDAASRPGQQGRIRDDYWLKQFPWPWRVRDYPRA